MSWETSACLLLRAQVELGKEQVGNTCECNSTLGLAIVKYRRHTQLKESMGSKKGVGDPNLCKKSLCTICHSYLIILLIYFD